MKTRNTRNTFGDKPGHYPERTATRSGDEGRAYGTRQRREGQLTYSVAMRSGWVSVSNEARLRVQALEKPYKGALYEGFYDPVAPRDDVIRSQRIHPKRKR